MPFTLIKGTFRVVGLSPDGDSIRFVPDDDALVSALLGGSAGSKPSRQLRLEGIDALETHYNARHQPSRWAFAATEAILAFAGVRNVQWDSRHATIVAADDETRGWILARHKEKYNRPVAFLFAGETPDGDGTSVTLDEDLLRRSFNLQALQEGLAYPTFYASLFADLRAAMTAAAVDARTAERGLWQDDRTTAGFEATSLGVLMDEVPILPKLF
ncbi:nuclease [Methylobacterium sp. DB1607]|nr:nuclease [Methylobacterium sp. DB1607]